MHSFITVVTGHRRTATRLAGFFAAVATVLAAAALAPSGVAQAAPPPNDTFSGLSIGALPYEHTADTTQANVQPGETMSSCNATTHTVWYNLTLAQSAAVRLETFGSSFDTAIGVFTGSQYDELTEIACNDDSGTGTGTYALNSTVEFTANAGTTYRIQVSSAGMSGGSLKFRATSGPVNDDFADAEQVTWMSYTDHLDQTNLSSEYVEKNGSCSMGYPAYSAWYRVSGIWDDALQVNTFGSDGDTRIAVWVGNDMASLAPVACNDDAASPPPNNSLNAQVFFTAVPGNTYYVQVFGSDGYPASGLDVRFSQVANDPDGDGAWDVDDNCDDAWNPGQENNDRDFIFLDAKPFDDKTRAMSDQLGDACDLDDDNDGRPDGDEIIGSTCAGAAIVTDPMDPDSDNDHVLDGVECARNTSPVNALVEPALAFCSEDAILDYDGDGLHNGREVCHYGTDPFNPDSDGDGCSDGREAASVNGDRAVNVIDLQQIASAMGPYVTASAPHYFDFDYNKNGSIDVIDLQQVAARIGTCPPAP